MQYVTESGGARMAEARVPKVDTGGEGEVAGGGGGGHDRVHVAGAVTSVEKHAGMFILHRKTRGIFCHTACAMSPSRTTVWKMSVEIVWKNQRMMVASMVV